MRPLTTRGTVVKNVKISVALRGNHNGIGNKSRFGQIWSKQERERHRQAIAGSKNYLWKGAGVSYSGKHHWIKRWFGKATQCENKNCIYPRVDFHGKLMVYPRRFEWANLSGQYKRDINDYIQLCVSCHRNLDKGNLVL